MVRPFVNQIIPCTCITPAGTTFQLRVRPGHAATQTAIRAEHKLLVQDALNSMDAPDREVLVLRHFEQLTNDETALALGIKKSAASQRYVRALKRLKEILASIPGLKENL